MCELSEKLVRWMDGELTGTDAAVIDGHLKECQECRERLAVYREASDGFTVYCHAAVTTCVGETRRRIPRWIFAAAAAAVTLLVVLAHDERHSPGTATGLLSSPLAVTTPTARPEVGSLSARLAQPSEKPAKSQGSERVPTHDRSGQASPARTPARWVASMPAGPSIEIAIPSDAIFPPGAMPAGMSFVANVTLGTDGSAERLRLEPQLVEFERRAPRP
jgi:hypothetical protein